MSYIVAFYDLEYGPVSYDFVTWLVRARKKAGERGLHVVIVPKEDGLGGFARHWGKHDEAATRWRLWHIVIASCPLAGATVTLAPSREEAEIMLLPALGETDEHWWPRAKVHFMGPLVEAARRGEVIPKLRATEAARRYVANWFPQDEKKLVTLTVRNQTTDETRNSNVQVWERLANMIDRMDGYRSFLLRDSNDALCETLSCGAEVDPDLRLALYESAAMNLVGNNGPQELLKFSEAPFIAFAQGLGGWQDHFRKYFAMEPGEQLPWARKDQRLVYEPDTFEVMKREFEAWASATR